VEVCVIGAGGLVGLPLCRQLLAEGHKVTGVTVSSAQPENIACSHWESGANALRRVFRGGEVWDVIYDLRAYHPTDLDGLVERVSALTRHWIHVSTIYIYFRFSKTWTSADPACPSSGPIREDTPCNPSGDYGIGKAACEKVWFQAINRARAPVTITRLPFIYGPEDRSKRSSYYIRAIQSCQKFKLPMGGTKYIELVFSHDIAKALTRISENPLTIGHALNVSVGTPTTLRAHVQAIAETIGANIDIGVESLNPYVKERPPFAFPIDVVLDITRLRSFIGSVEPTPLLSAWKATVEVKCREAT